MRYSDDPSADDKIREDCVPGVPHVTFCHQPGVYLDFRNPQPQSGLFDARLPVWQGDTPLKLASRIVKYHRHIKGSPDFFVQLFSILVFISFYYLNHSYSN